MIYYILKSGICLGVLLTVYHLFLKNEKLYKFNRFFLLGSLVFSLSVPFISLPVLVAVPQKINDLNPSYLETENLHELLAFDLSPPESTEQTARILVPPVKKTNWVVWVLIIYGTGLFFSFSRFSMQLFGFYRMVNQHGGVKKDGYRIVLLPQETLPFTFFHYLFVNSESYQNHGIEEEILQHELAHIKQKHSIDIIIAEILKCVFWFNPIFYCYKKAIQLNHEFLADQAVVKTLPNVSEYQHLLLSKVLGKEFLNHLSSPFNYSVTRLRLMMMKKSTSKSRALVLRVSILPLAIFLILIFSQRNINTNPSFDLIPFSQQEKGFEAYIKEALSEESAYVLELEKFDIEGAKQAYDQLSEEEKSRATEFPFLEDDVVEVFSQLQKAQDSLRVRINFSNPPEKKVIKYETWENWKNTKNLEVSIDGNTIERFKLEDFTPEDFALFEVRGIEKKKLFKKEKFALSLTTHEHYEAKFILNRKKVETLIVAYPDGNEAEVPYFIKHILRLPNSDLGQNSSEDFLRRALESILTYEFKDYPSKNAIMDIRNSFGLNVTRNGKKEMVVISYQ
jgi:bla regulator protein blaR1